MKLTPVGTACIKGVKQMDHRQEAEGVFFLQPTMAQKFKALPELKSCSGGYEGSCFPLLPPCPSVLSHV